MLNATDFNGAVPFHQDCAPDMLKVLPANTYVKLVFVKGSEEIGRVLSRRSYFGDPQIELPCRKLFASSYYHRLAKVVPLPDQAVLSAFAPGTKVSVDTRHPQYLWPLHVAGVVSGQTARRVRVWLQFKDGSTAERTYYPSQLLPV